MPQHGIHEHANPRRRFEHTGGADAVICQHVRDGVGYLFGGVESGQHGRFQRIHKPLVLCFVLAVLTDKPVQLHCRGEQFEVGFRPPDGIRQFLFQSALGGYEQLNEDKKLLPDGATLLDGSCFVYGSAVHGSMEVFLTDRVLFLVKAQGRFLFGTDVHRFRPAVSAGLRFNF